MALIEVDQDEFAKLQAELTTSRSHRDWMNRVGGNPKTRRKLLELVREDNPSVAIPELDAAAPILSEVAEERKARQALEKRLDDEKLERETRERAAAATSQIEREHERLRAQGWSTEGIAKIEAVMGERGLLDYEAGAALVEKQQPKEDALLPSNYGRNWDLFEPPAEDNDIKRGAVAQPRRARSRAPALDGQSEVQQALRRCQWGEPPRAALRSRRWQSLAAPASYRRRLLRSSPNCRRSRGAPSSPRSPSSSISRRRPSCS
jgi:hypothetical protein